jgi:hypothetical protein
MDIQELKLLRDVIERLRQTVDRHYGRTSENPLAATLPTIKRRLGVLRAAIDVVFACEGYSNPRLPYRSAIHSSIFIRHGQ